MSDKPVWEKTPNGTVMSEPGPDWVWEQDEDHGGMRCRRCNTLITNWARTVSPPGGIVHLNGPLWCKCSVRQGGG